MNLIGVDPTKTTEDPEYGLGQRYTHYDGKEYVYLRANGAVTGDGYVVSYEDDYDAAMVDTDTAATVTQGTSVAVAEAAVTDDYYFWGQIYGPCGIRSEQDALANGKLAPTADDGQVDDAGSVGTKYIQGMVFDTATGGADAVNTTGFVTYPVIALVGTYA